MYILIHVHKFRILKYVCKSGSTYNQILTCDCKLKFFKYSLAVIFLSDEKSRFLSFYFPNKYPCIEIREVFIFIARQI